MNPDNRFDPPDEPLNLKFATMNAVLYLCYYCGYPIKVGEVIEWNGDVLTCQACLENEFGTDIVQNFVCDNTPAPVIEPNSANFKVAVQDSICDSCGGEIKFGEVVRNGIHGDEICQRCIEKNHPGAAENFKLKVGLNALRALRELLVNTAAMIEKTPEQEAKTKDTLEKMAEGERQILALLGKK